MTSAAVRSKAVVLLFIVYCCTHCLWKVGCFIVIVFLMSCGCYCSLPHLYSVMGWSAVSDCGISWPYSLTFCTRAE